MPPVKATFLRARDQRCHPKKLGILLAFLLALALLVSNAAAGLASRLAGSLALAASAVLCALAQIASLDGLDVFHDGNLHKMYCGYYSIFGWKVNR